MKLVIVESPAKAKTIEKYLGSGYVVMASVGHVRDLPKSNKNAIDIEAGFVPHYEVVAQKRDVIAKLKKAAEKADEIILATDPDREGEAIAWHLVQALGLGDASGEWRVASKKPASRTSHPATSVSRIVFHEITKDAVQEAMKNPRGIDEHLRRAQEARRVLDRLVGYDLSGLIWKKVRYGLSAGRVQSPALRILMEREREIRAFKPEDYWVIIALVKNELSRELSLTCVEESRERKRVDEILKSGKGGKWFVKEVKETEAKRHARPPFTTSTLQQTASTRLGFSPSRTMRAAQKLYEQGLITYMRTDSTNLAAGARAQMLAVIEKEFGKEYAHATAYKSTSKNAQEAHEAIRPTNASKKKAGNDDDQHRLYELIWRRAIASQMSAANILQTKIIANSKTDLKDFPDFTANGSRVLFAGWLAADPAARGEDVELPKVDAGEKLELLSLEDTPKQTQPPSRYSEAGLIKELEKRGIGRPSTYASIIGTLEDRGYVLKEGRTLMPTDTGDVVSTFLEDNFTQYISDSFTSEMEDELDEIARGERGYEKTLGDFYKPFSKDVAAKAKDAKKITDMGPAPEEFKCPKCGADMVIKLGRSGKFMSCSRFPECDGARTIDGSEIADPEAIGHDPETGLPVFVLMGPYGPYVQLGLKDKVKKPKNKPKRASIPKDKNPDEVTLEDALKYLSLPRELGPHPDTKEPILANVGRFGPYISHEIKPKPDFRSLKEDDVYAITLERALEILAQPKKTRFGRKKKAPA